MTDTYSPRRLRIMQPGMEGYNGPFGLVDFTDGVSDFPVGWQEAARLGALVTIEDYAEPNFQVSPAAEMMRNLDRTAEDPLVKRLQAGEHVNAEGAAVIERHTAESLEEIADKQGLSGVREIARRWSRTGRSIKECIDAVLEAQHIANGGK